MEPKNFSTINLTQKEIKDIQQFCNLNKIEDIPTFLHTCAWKGYEVEKFGILGKTGGIQEKRVEIEVIREKRVEIPVEVIKERQLVRQMREQQLGEGAEPLPPLMVAGIILEGGIIDYNSNTKTGGNGARFLGIGPYQQYSEDQVTISMRLVSVLEWY